MNLTKTLRIFAGNLFFLALSPTYLAVIKYVSYHNLKIVMSQLFKGSG